MKNKQNFVLFVAFGIIILTASCKKVQTCTCTSTINGQPGPTSAANVSGSKKDRQRQCDDVKIEHDQLVASGGSTNYTTSCEIK